MATTKGSLRLRGLQVWKYRADARLSKKSQPLAVYANKAGFERDAADHALSTRKHRFAIADAR